MRTIATGALSPKRSVRARFSVPDPDAQLRRLISGYWSAERKASQAERGCLAIDDAASDRLHARVGRRHADFAIAVMTTPAATAAGALSKLQVAAAWFRPELDDDDVGPITHRADAALVAIADELAGLGLAGGAAASALGESADADLLALVSRCRRLSRRAQAALESYGDAEERRVWPPLPPALTFLKEDWRAGVIGQVGEPIPTAMVDLVRERLRSLPKSKSVFSPLARALARLREIVAAADAHKSALRAAEREAGMPTADRRSRRLFAELDACYSRITATPARTCAGVVVKLLATAEHVEILVSSFTDWEVPKVHASAVADALAITGEGEESTASAAAIRAGLESAA